jgi:hypothetical protein
VFTASRLLAAMNNFKSKNAGCLKHEIYADIKKLQFLSE